MDYSQLITLHRVLPEDLQTISARVELARLRSAMEPDLAIYQQELQRIQKSLDEPEAPITEWPPEAKQDLQTLMQTEVDEDLPPISEEHLRDSDDISTDALQLLLQTGLLQ